MSYIGLSIVAMVIYDWHIQKTTYQMGAVHMVQSCSVHKEPSAACPSLSLTFTNNCTARDRFVKLCKFGGDTIGLTLTKMSLPKQ